MGRSVFLLLSWSLTPLRLIAGAMDDVNLNFALIAALFCASSGGKNSIISESVGSPSHIGVPYMEDAMDRGGAGRNANALLSSATIETSTVVSGSNIHSIERAGSSAPIYVCVWVCIEYMHIDIYVCIYIFRHSVFHTCARARALSRSLATIDERGRRSCRALDAGMEL